MSPVTKTIPKIYRLKITDELNPTGIGKPRRIVCTYPNGHRSHGSGPHGNHPPVILTVRNQDEILWTGDVNFKVTLEFRGYVRTRADEVLRRPIPSRLRSLVSPFYRTTFVASKGSDGKYRVASGPLDKGKVTRRAEYKFTVTRLTSAGVVDQKSERLDPHIVVEP